MEIQFDPKGVNQPIDEIVPDNDITTDLDDALEEIKPVVGELSKDVSGIGQKAAERYLLRYEYGMATNELASEFDVAPQTVSNQISGVRKKVLKYPRLTRIIGTLRSHRANLSKPDLDDGRNWSGEVKLKGEKIQYSVEFKSGAPGRTYSWCYSCESRYEHDTRAYHLFEDYIIDAIHGTFLKRLMWGVSFSSWNRPVMGDKYEYTAYPLPNLEIPNNRNGSLIDAAEYHWSFDTRNHFESFVTNERKKGDLESRAEHGERPPKGSAYYAQDDVLLDRIRNGEDPAEAIEDYAETVHIRNNIERLLRMYPLDAPYDLPFETVTQLWNGQPSDHDQYYLTQDVNQQPLYALTTQAKSRHVGRDVRVNGNKHTVKMPMWTGKI